MSWGSPHCGLLDYTFLSLSSSLHGLKLIIPLGFGWEGQRDNENLEESSRTARVNSPSNTIKADSIFFFFFFWWSAFSVHSKRPGKHPRCWFQVRKYPSPREGEEKARGLGRPSPNAHGPKTGVKVKKHVAKQWRPVRQNCKSLHDANCPSFITNIFSLVIYKLASYKVSWLLGVPL